MLGTLLGGRYRLDAQIGRGGMSTVYRAFDIVLERPVAIKLMHREIASDSDQLERFRREARSVAQLNHPHIVTVIDAGEEPSPESPLADGGEAGSGTGGGELGAGVGTGRAGTPFIVLEYVEGETLKALIRRDRLGRRSRDRQGPGPALPRRREHGRRSRGGARDRGLPHRAGDR